jgi:hypothetical protein
METPSTNDRERVAGLVSRLNEYAKLLRELASEAIVLMNRKHNRGTPEQWPSEQERQGIQQLVFALQARVQFLSQKVHEVARRVSPLIEHSIEDEIVKLELSLVLADVESSARYAQQVVGAALHG